MGRVFFIIGFLLFLRAGYAENITPKADNGEGPSMGIGGTVYQTWGFLYRQYFPSQFGVAGSIGGWMDDYSGKIGTAVGSSYTFAHHHFPTSFLASSSIRIYAIAYLAGIFKHERDYKCEKGSNKDCVQKYFAFDLGLGVGPGAEFFFTPNFAIHLELPWMTFVTFKRSDVWFRSSHPHVGGGLSYYF